eukprot:TRINITY_DN45546_c0_g1_i1.p1 TRINITY_DN45546_c0_g1~~TRINITY_DN45546_c0_g1_i1.p1  ORF type:complete len:151 (-),score=12.24 TRINITY_DN45546_c0_g1_i1:205-657(-)
MMQHTSPNIPVRVRKSSKNSYRLEVTKTQHSRVLLQQLLRHGLICKRRAAELALTLSQSNHLEVREELFKLSGNQARYRRLDASGCERARHILNVGAALRRSSDTQVQERIRLSLDRLKCEHRFLTAVHHAGVLRRDIRYLLSLGAARKC